MTKIFYREYYDRNLIIIEGHSGYDVSGSDVVCAGVSALVCTLVNCLRDECSAERIQLLRDVVRSGYVCFEVESYDFAKERIKDKAREIKDLVKKKKEEVKKAAN